FGAYAVGTFEVAGGHEGCRNPCRRAESKSCVTHVDRRAVLHVDRLGKPGKPGLPPLGHGESHGPTSGPSMGRASLGAKGAKACGVKACGRLRCVRSTRSGRRP